MADLTALARYFATELGPALTSIMQPLQIVGVEVTQAIQHCRAREHLTDERDRRPDNSLALVADKPAVVRVYVRGGLRDLTGVRGTVMVQRQRLGLWVDTDHLAVIAPGVTTAFRDAPFESTRGSMLGSLNFSVPGRDMQGRMRLRVRVEQTAQPDVHDELNVIVHATLRQTLRLRGVPVRYWGPDPAGNPTRLAAPTQADFERECAWICNAWPVSPRPDVTLAGTFTWSNPLTGNMAGGDCPDSWSDLLFWLAIARYLDGDLDDRFYYALLPNGVPVGDTGGCGAPGAVGAGFLGGNGGVSLAHELGHVLGFDHVRGSLPPDDDEWDPAYPAYEPYDSETMRTGTIGEYGLDVTTTSVRSPNWCTDFMGYGPGRWVSPYQHRRLIRHPMLHPVHVPLPADAFPPVIEEGPAEWPPGLPVPPDDPWGPFVDAVRPPTREPAWVVVGMQTAGRVDVRHVLQLDLLPGVTGPRLRGQVVEFVDDQEQVIARAPVHVVPTRACGGDHGQDGTPHGSRGCGCGGCGGCGGTARRQTDGDPARMVVAKVPHPGAEQAARVAGVRLLEHGRTVWSRQAPARPPELGGVEAGVDGDQVIVRWQSSAADDAARLDRFVRWSGDDGETWQTLALGVDEDEFVGAAGPLPPGPVLVHVVVSDGFHTVTSEPAFMEVPWRPPSAAVLWPRAEAPVDPAAPLRLWGVATSCDGHPVDDERLEWALDGDTVARGADAWVPAPLSVGEHHLVLRVDDGHSSAESEVVFTVREPRHG
ncbi:hypothetical protein [Humibacillus xanthopallidus]|uniref:hypothetical protein n=1 Tax=Humibacillus xanthopallidus TaxID=412689 RepID=UPI003851022E